MKKYKTTKIMIMGMALWMLGSITPAMAYTSCVGGTEITTYAHTDSNAPTGCNPQNCPAAKKFCVSNFFMGWFSAFAWCKSNGGTLASLEEICTEHVTIKDQAGDCPAIEGRGKGNMVTRSGLSSTTFLFIRSTGAVNNSTRPGGWNAICK